MAANRTLVFSTLRLADERVAALLQVIACEGLATLTKLTSLELKEVFACKGNLQGLHLVAAALHNLPCMQRFVLDEKRIHVYTVPATASSLSAGLAALSLLTELTIVGVNMDVEVSRCGPVLALSLRDVASALQACWDRYI